MPCRWIVTLVGVLAVGSPASADVVLRLSSATVAQSGDSGQVCVSLDTGGENVAGTQNDLVWDGRCATLPDESACAVAGSHGKQLDTRIQATDDFRLRALILSLTDVDPIADGLLYCCDFTVDAAPGACCSVAIDRPGASDTKGNAVAVTGRPGELCVAAVEDPSPTRTPTATPPPSNNDDDGCQVTPARGTAAAPWLAALALLLLRRRH